jgi:hypothetical protein
MHAHAACAEKNRNVGSLIGSIENAGIPHYKSREMLVWRTPDRRSCQRNRLPFSALPQIAFPRHSGIRFVPQPTQPLGNRVHRYRPRCPPSSIEAISAECTWGQTVAKTRNANTKRPLPRAKPVLSCNALCSCKCLQTRHALAPRSLLQPQRSRNRLPLVHAIYGPNHLAQIKGGSLKKHPFRLIWPN